MEPVMSETVVTEAMMSKSSSVAVMPESSPLANKSPVMMIVMMIIVVHIVVIVMMTVVVEIMVRFGSEEGSNEEETNKKGEVHFYLKFVLLKG